MTYFFSAQSTKTKMQSMFVILVLLLLVVVNAQVELIQDSEDGGPARPPLPLFPGPGPLVCRGECLCGRPGLIIGVGRTKFRVLTLIKKFCSTSNTCSPVGLCGCKRCPLIARKCVKFLAPGMPARFICLAKCGELTVLCKKCPF